MRAPSFVLCLLALVFGLAEAFMVTSVAKPGLRAPRTAAPQAMLAAPSMDTVAASLPTILIADDTIALASGVGGLLFVLLVVGTVVVNFGIRK